MKPIRLSLRAEDASVMADVTAELDQLRGKEPEGVALLLDESPRTTAIDPAAVIVGIALASGVASGAGRKLGEVVMTWLIARIRKVAKKKKAKVSLKVAGREVTVDGSTDPEALGAELARALEAP